MNDKILISELPIMAVLGDLYKNLSLAHKITIAIAEKRFNDAFNMANEIFDNNDAIIEANIDTEALTEIINSIKSENEKYN